MSNPLRITHGFILICCLAWLPSPALAQDGPDITFLEGDAARAAIVDESVEPYISLLCHHEMAVKSGIEIEGETLEEQQAFFAQHYADNVLDFTDAEREMLAAVVGLTKSLVSIDYAGFAAQPWSFIKVTSGVEQGLPHTRGHSIVLSQGVLAWMVNAKSDDRDIMHRMVMAKVELMLHEQMHVIQRLNPEPFAAFYTEHWGLVHVEQIEYGDDLEAMQLINPDGVDTRWVQFVDSPDGPRFLQPNIFIARFEDRASRMPHDFQMRAVQLAHGDDGVWRPVATGDTGNGVTTMLLNEPGYTAHYGPSTNIYHPHESLADLFAKMILNDFGSYPEPGFAEDEEGEAKQAAFRAAVAPVRAFMREAFGVVQADEEDVAE